MKLGDELGFCLPNVVHIVNDKETHKGLVLDSWNVSNFDFSMSEEYDVKVSEEPIEASHTKKMDEFRNVAKNVNECELPELIVCYKETLDDNVVKDICVDDGVPSLGRILLGHDVDDDKVLRTRQCTSMDLETMVNEEVMAESHDLTSTNVSEAVCEKSTGESETDNFCNVNDKKSDIVSIKSTEDSKTDNLYNSETESAQNSDFGRFQDLKDEMIHGESSFSMARPLSGLIKTESAQNNDFGYFQDLKDGMIHGQPSFSMAYPLSDLIKTESAQNNEYGRFQTLQDGAIYGESGFSMAGPLSGLITYSGSIAYSGSCSLRSDSSTTSARSFAFPVLQAEWNNSPVRMRSAGRRKHRRWRQDLLCCRF